MEWFIVLLVILLFFGARKLPEIARSMGRSGKEFKAGLKEGAQQESSVEGPCPFCGVEVPTDAKFCAGCGQMASEVCARRAAIDSRRS